MASGFGLQGRLEIAQQACDLEAASGAVAGGGTRGDAKVMLVDSSYTFDAVNHDHVDNSGAGDPIDQEISVGGYTGGYGGAGRKIISGSLSPTWARDDGNTRIEFDFTDPSAWTLSSGVTIGGVGLIVEDFEGTTGNDTQSLFVAFDDTNDVPTNGGDVTYSPNAEGVLQI